MKRVRRVGRGVLIVTDSPDDLRAPQRSPETDVGWAVSELFEAAWIASGRDPAALSQSPRAAAAREQSDRKRG